MTSPPLAGPEVPVVRAVWSDFGGVLTDPTDVTLAAFCARKGLLPTQLLRVMRIVGDRFGTDPMAPLDTPLISQNEWSDLVSAALARHFDVNIDLADFAAVWFQDRPANSAWIAVLREMRGAGYTVGMLSNMVPAWEEHWRRMVPAEELFDEVVVSFEVGHRKPDPGIFAWASERVGCRPQECVLVDDLEVNCAGARAAGWLAVRFVQVDQAVAALAELDAGLADALHGLGPVVGGQR
jgi:putative hydrolase of the HAD superfamily